MLPPLLSKTYPPPLFSFLARMSGQCSGEWASSVKSSRGRKARAGWPKLSALMISLLLCSPSPHTLSLLCSLPPSGALTKETWLSQRPAADLLIHSLCPFDVLLQTYLQRRRKREEGFFEGKTWRVRLLLFAL